MQLYDSDVPLLSGSIIVFNGPASIHHLVYKQAHPQTHTTACHDSVPMWLPTTTISKASRMPAASDVSSWLLALINRTSRSAGPELMKQV